MAAVGMIPCAFKAKRGRCGQWVPGLIQRGQGYSRRRDVCTYHDLVLAGLIGADHVRGRRGSADVVSDEQREFAAVLRAMGAEPDVVRAALTKDPHTAYSARKMGRTA